MNTYNITYLGRSGGGSANVKASSASDAKAIFESKTPGSVVYKVSEPEGTIEFMSYQDAEQERDAMR
jgi:hypothetical protein